MPISFRRSALAGIFTLFLTAIPAIAQDTAPVVTPAMRFFNRIDFGISAAGEITDTVSGIEQRDATLTHSMLTIRPSSTVGELFTLRYTARPYLGFELNVGNLRYSQDYTFVPPPAPSLLFGGAQTSAREMTLGYVAHLPFRPLGVTPFVGVGGGTIRFKPTPGGGQGLPQQYRAAYYYQAGLEDNFPGSHFGVRVGFRQLIYLAPDFLQNYLTITRRVRTSEPTFGLFLRF